MLEYDDFFTVTDLKQVGYCARVIYYERCLPHVRPRTVKMDAGRDAHDAEQERASRRTLAAYGVTEGKRVFDLKLACPDLRLRGMLDEVVWTNDDVIFPVDYKLAKKVSPHHKLQLTAYAMLLEVNYTVKVDFGYLYLMPSREMVKVMITPRSRNDVERRLVTMRQMVEYERMPEPAKKESYCVNCEFRRFCNDVF